MNLAPHASVSRENCAVDSARDRLAAGSAIVTVALFGGTFLWNVAPYWQVNPQYSFGWIVPFLAAFLLVRRWPGRPAASSPKGRGATVFLIVTALAFTPIWLVVQPNPDWRLVTWALAVAFVEVTLSTIYFAGGRTWMRYFAFPVLFILAAVPWPFGFEYELVQNLMRGVASVTVEILSWFNIAAIEHGNLIQVPTGILGVDEACSGIRSLQATLMASLFLGEFYWLRASKRTVLVVVGLTLALICNVGRATFIAVVAARHGLEAITHWHDPAGYTILTLCLIGVVIAARLCGIGSSPAPTVNSGDSAHALPRGLFLGVAVWLLLSIAATEVWYRAHEGRAKIHWSFGWPESRAKFTELSIPERSRDLLLYDEGKCAAWQEPDGTSWSAFFFRWNAGSTRSRVVPRSHRPEICFPASGYTMDADYGIRSVQAAGISLPFHVYRFRKDREIVDVFSCMWQDHAQDASETPTDREWSRLAGLGFVLRGERSLSQQVLEFTMVGYSTPEAAERAFLGEIEHLIVR